MSHRTWNVALSALWIVSLFLGAQMSSPVMAQSGAQPVIDAELQAQIAKGANQVSYWILFREAPDLSLAYQTADWNLRGEVVLQELQAAASRSQSKVQAYLAAQGVSYQSYWVNNSILVKSSPAKTVTDLLAFPEIQSMQARKEFILYEPVNASTADAGPKGIETNITRVNADDAWGLGYTGEGIVVANIDTGVRYTHQALNAQYRGNLGGGNYDHNYNWFDPYQDAPNAPFDGHGHGSHTMGIILGDDGSSNQTGMAPDAKWIACRGCNTSNCTDEALLTCAQFMVAPTDLVGDAPDPSKRPNVVNNSWGDCEQTYNNWFQGAVDAWHAAGIYPVFSNGNAGNCSYSYPPGLNTVGNPARYGNVTGVGSTGKSDGIYATHSNWGPTDNLDTVNPVAGFEMMKPQVVAPGENIRSSLAGSDTSYGPMTGTSMSAPHVAGLIALIWDAAPCLTGDYAATETLIEQTATHITYNDGSALTPTDYPNFATGWGEINALAAVQAAASRCTATLQGTITNQSNGSPLEGAQVHIYDGAKLDRYVTSGAAGGYSAPLQAGTYTIQVSLANYLPRTLTGIVVGATQTVTQDIALTPAGTVTISGTVLDASGHGYPLAARIKISAVGFKQTLYTDPFDGTYQIPLIQGQVYHFETSTILPGYLTLQQDINVGDGGVINFEMQVDPVNCYAPGYALSEGFRQTFDLLASPALPGGWTSVKVSGADPDNYWNTNEGTRNPAGSAYSSPNVLMYGTYYINSGNQARLVIGDVAIQSGNSFFFQMYHDDEFSGSNDRVQVQVSTDGGASWTSVGPEFSRYSASPGWSQKSVSLEAYAGQTVKLAILGTSAYGNDIHLDDLSLGMPVCQKAAGGLVGGYVTDGITAAGINGALVSGGLKTTQSFAVAGSPYGDGLYYTFAEIGTKPFQAEETTFGSDSHLVTVSLDGFTRQDFVLHQEGWGKISGNVSGGLECDQPGGALEGAQAQVWTRDIVPQAVATATAGADGAYTLWAMPGTYDLRFSQAGYEDWWLRNLVLTADGNLTVDTMLRLLAPCIVYSPPELSIQLLPFMTGNRAVTVTNTGAQGVAYTVSSGQTQQIADGGFEAGTTSSPWIQYSSTNGTPVCDLNCGLTGQRSGNWWAWFGRTSGENAYVSQLVVIPPGVNQLSFYVKQENCGSAGASNNLRLIIDATEFWRTDGLDPACGGLTYRKVVVDISPVANGMSHVIKFEGNTVDSSRFFLDDVSIQTGWSNFDVNSGLLPGNGGSQVILIQFNSGSLNPGIYNAWLELLYTSGKQSDIKGSAKVPYSMHVITQLPIYFPMIVR